MGVFLLSLVVAAGRRSAVRDRWSRSGAATTVAQQLFLQTLGSIEASSTRGPHARDAPGRCASPSSRLPEATEINQLATMLRGGGGGTDAFAPLALEAHGRLRKRRPR